MAKVSTCEPLFPCKRPCAQQPQLAELRQSSAPPWTKLRNTWNPWHWTSPVDSACKSEISPVNFDMWGLESIYAFVYISTFSCQCPRTLFQTTVPLLRCRSTWQQYMGDFSNMTDFASTGKRNIGWGRSASTALERIGHLNLRGVCLAPLLNFCSSWNTTKIEKY